jgi:hypothetical protein
LPFAGCRRKEGLGRSVVVDRGSSSTDTRTGDSGCPLDAEEGNVVGMRIKGTCTRRKRDDPRLVLGMARPSLGPRTRARQSPLTSPAQAGEGGACESASRSGKPAQAGGTDTGVVACGRRAARRASPLRQRRCVTRQEKDGGRGLPPCEDRELGFGCPHVEVQLQKSVGSVRSQISSAHAPQKGRSGSSERGPSSG